MYKNLLLKLNILCVILLAISLGYKIILSDSVATAGVELSNIEAERDLLTKENEYLESKYFTITSLQSISARAESEGYVPAGIDYLPPDELASR